MSRLGHELALPHAHPEPRVCAPGLDRACLLALYVFKFFDKGAKLALVYDHVILLVDL